MSLFHKDKTKYEIWNWHCVPVYFYLLIPHLRCVNILKAFQWRRSRGASKFMRPGEQIAMKWAKVIIWEQQPNMEVENELLSTKPIRYSPTDCTQAGRTNFGKWRSRFPAGVGHRTKFTRLREPRQFSRINFNTLFSEAMQNYDRYSAYISICFECLLSFRQLIPSS